MREQASGAGGAAFDPALWEGADVIPDFLTSEDEGSSDLLEALVREGVDSDAESGGVLRPDSPKSSKEGQGAVESLGVKKAIGQSALGDPKKSAVGPSRLNADEGMVSDGEEPEGVPGLPRGGTEATARKAVVVKRAAGSAMFGRPAKKANVAKGSKEKAPVKRETGGVEEETAGEAVESLLDRNGRESVREEVRDPTVVGESANGSEVPQSDAMASVSVEAPKGGATESGRSSGGPTAGATESRKVAFAEPALKQKKRKGGLGAMFGARPGRGGSEERSAKAAAERVKASLALPFTPVGVMELNQRVESAEERGDGSRLEMPEEGVLGKGEVKGAERSGLDEENGVAPLEDVMMLEGGEQGEEEQTNGGSQEAVQKADPEAEKLALFGTQSLPQPISQAYRKTGGSAQTANGESGSSGREAANGQKAQVTGTSGSRKKKGSLSEDVSERFDDGKSGSERLGDRALPLGPGASALEAGCEGLAKGGKFDFAAAAGALGLRSFLNSKPPAGTKESGKGGKPAKQSRGSKPEQQSYGAQKEEPGHNFNPFASMEEEGAGIKAGKRSQAFPRSGNRMSTFRR